MSTTEVRLIPTRHEMCDKTKRRRLIASIETLATEESGLWATTHVMHIDVSTFRHTRRHPTTNSKSMSTNPRGSSRFEWRLATSPLRAATLRTEKYARRWPQLDATLATLIYAPRRSRATAICGHERCASDNAQKCVEHVASMSIRLEQHVIIEAEIGTDNTVATLTTRNQQLNSK